MIKFTNICWHKHIRSIQGLIINIKLEMFGDVLHRCNYVRCVVTLVPLLALSLFLTNLKRFFELQTKLFSGNMWISEHFHFYYMWHIFKLYEVLNMIRSLLLLIIM